MKKITIILIAFMILFTGCEIFADCDTYPNPPYGSPNETDKYSTTDYKSITYTYYCVRGKYRSITYSNYDCDGWEKSEFESSCIK